MFNPTQKLKDEVADAVVNVLIKNRRSVEDGLKINGEVVAPTEPPRFLQVAAYLHLYVCTAGDRWRTEQSMVKMVERAVRDLDLEVKATLEDPAPEPDVGEYVDYLRSLRLDMQSWLDQDIEKG